MSTKLTNLTAADGIDGTESLYVVKSGNSRKTTTSVLLDQDNMTDGTTNKNFTATEKTKLAGIETGADVTDATNVNAAGAVMNTDTATTDMQFVGTGSDLSIDPEKLLKRGDAADAIDAAVPPVVATRTALAAVATADHAAAYLTEAGREGTFLWDSSDLSAKVTADASEGIYIAPTSDATGASGAWVRRYDGYINVKWFGATGDGLTDDTAAIQAAIDFCESLISTFSLGGLTLFFPRGGYLISSGLTIKADHIVLRGEGRNSSCITASSPDFDMITASEASGDALYGTGIFDMSVTATGNATAGAVVKFDNVVDGVISNVECRGFWNGIDLLGANRTRLWGVTLSNSLRSGGSGNDAIRFYGSSPAGAASDIHLTDVQVWGGGFAYNASLKIVGVDGVYVENSHFIEGVFGVDILPDNTAGNTTVASVKFTNCYFDTCTNNCVRLFGAASTAFRSIGFVNCTFRDAGGDGFLSNPTTSQVYDVSFVGCNFRQNTNRGVYFADGDADQILIVGCIFDGNNTDNTSTAGDIRFDGGSNLVITGCQFAGGGASGTAVHFGSSVVGGVFSQSEMGASTAGTKVTNSATSLRVNSVRGYTLRNSGSVTINNGSTTATVNHGLAVTPSSADIRITMRNDAAGVTRAWVDNPTSTTFRLNVNATPTTSGTWDWEVDSER